jgi:Ethanolamine utilization protein EutJ (predicted chaperonin)
MADLAVSTFTIQVRIPANFLSSAGVSSKNITNTASVSATELDPDTSNNTATATTNVIESADVSISKSCKPDSAASAGSTAYCDLIVTNWACRARRTLR